MSHVEDRHRRGGRVKESAPGQGSEGSVGSGGEAAGGRIWSRLDAAVRPTQPGSRAVPLILSLSGVSGRPWGFGRLTEGDAAGTSARTAINDPSRASSLERPEGDEGTPGQAGHRGAVQW